MELVTDKGIPVDMRRIESAQGYDMEPHTVDILEAWVGGEPAGYMMMMYLDQTTFDSQFPTAWDYAINEEGSEYAPLKDLTRVPPAGRSREHWMQMFKASRMRSAQMDEIKDLPLDQLSERWQGRQDKISSEVESSYLQFRSDWLNKPVVFSVRVYDETDYQRMIDGDKVEHKGPDFRGQSIGTLLYEAGASWMNEKGMNLWAGFGQSPSAEATWNKLDRRYGVEKRTAPHYGDVRQRKFLDGSQVQLMGPDGPVISQVSGSAAPPRQEADGPAITTAISEHLDWNL